MTHLQCRRTNAHGVRQRLMGDKTHKSECRRRRRAGEAGDAMTLFVWQCENLWRQLANGQIIR